MGKIHHKAHITVKGCHLFPHLQFNKTNTNIPYSDINHQKQSNVSSWMRKNFIFTLKIRFVGKSYSHNKTYSSNGCCKSQNSYKDKNFEWRMNISLYQAIKVWILANIFTPQLWRMLLHEHSKDHHHKTVYLQLEGLKLSHAKFWCERIVYKTNIQFDIKSRRTILIYMRIIWT